MITKEVWLSYPQEKKKQEIESCLRQIVDIEEGKHNLSGTKEQGRLSQVRKDLETFILNTLDWERGK